MRFRCEVSVEGGKTLNSVVRSLDRVESGATTRRHHSKVKRCYVWLTPSEMKLGLATTTEGMLVFAHLDAAGFFQSYTVESVANNEVYMTVGVANLGRAFGSASGSSFLIKLAKRNGAASLVIQFESRNTTIEHALPVQLARRHELEQYEPPSLPRVSLALRLPTSQILKTVVDKLQSKTIDLKFEHDTLALRVLNDAMVVKAFFSNLKRNGQDDLVLTVKTSNLAQALRAYAMDFQSLELCPFEGRLLLFRVNLHYADLQYYIPLVTDDDDDDFYYPPDDASAASSSKRPRVDHLSPHPDDDGDDQAAPSPSV